MARDLGVARIAGRAVRRAPKRCSTSTARPIVLAPARVELRGRRAGQRRARRDAALHAAASPAVRRRRAGRPGDDQRQPLERADRLRGRRRAGSGCPGSPTRFWSASGRSRGGWTIRSFARRRSGQSILRRARGYAPGAVAPLPTERPMLALGADLKNTITLVVDGQAFVSQHIGDLDHYDSAAARSEETIDDLVGDVRRRPGRRCSSCTTRIPQYASTAVAPGAAGCGAVARPAPSRPRRVGARRARRVGHARARRRLRRHRLRRRRHDLGRRAVRGQRPRGLRARRAPAARHASGGDAAARHPVQAAAGFLAELDGLAGSVRAAVLVSGTVSRGAPAASQRDVRTFADDVDRPAVRHGGGAARVHAAGHASKDRPRCGSSSSRGVAELAGSSPTRAIRERSAGLSAAAAARDRGPPARAPIRRDRARVPFGDCAGDRRGREPRSARRTTSTRSCSREACFRTQLLLQEARAGLMASGLRVWTNQQVPPNDGGISLGQAALAAVHVSTGRE